MSSSGTPEGGGSVSDDGRGDPPGSRGGGLSRVPSVIRKTATSAAVTISKINALKQTVNRHNDDVSGLLLSSKDSKERRKDIEKAFRECKEAFLEVANVLTNILEDRSVLTEGSLEEAVRRAVTDALRDGHVLTHSSQSNKPHEGNNDVELPLSYASAVSSASVSSRVQVSHGPAVDVPNLSSFFIVPENEGGELTSSQATKDTLCRIFKPSDCALRVNRITPARGNGVRIEARSPDIAKIKAHPAIAKAGLQVLEQVKLNPRLIVYGIPIKMTADEIRDELVAQNLTNEYSAHVKVVYTYPVRPKRSTTNCVLEVSPQVRKMLLNGSRIYLRYSACRFADHIWIRQCFKCLTFGHLAKDCTQPSRCAHCSEGHESKKCDRRDQLPKCANCARNPASLNVDVSHSASDTNKCPILLRKIRDKLVNINYG